MIMAFLVSTPGTRVQHTDTGRVSNVKSSARALQISSHRFVCTGKMLVRGRVYFTQMLSDLWIFGSQGLVCPFTAPSTLDMQEQSRVVE